MVALGSKESPDRLTRLIQYLFGYYLQDSTRRPAPTSWGPIYYFNDSMVSRIVSLISILLVSALLIGAMSCLYFVSDIGRILGIIAGFTICFALAVGLLTNAKRTEIFAATAA